MKQKTMILMALVALAVLVGSCHWEVEKNSKGTKKEKVEKNYNDLLPFERIRIDVPCDIYYTQGDTTKVKIVASRDQLISKTDVTVWGIKHSKKVYLKDFIDKIDVTSDGRWLQISKKKRSNWKRKNWLSIYVTSPDLIEVDMRGVGSFKAEGDLDTDTLRLSMEGVGSINIPSLICDRLQAKVAGAGSIQLSDVTAQETQLSMNGVGSIKVENFQNSGSVHCTMEGVGSIKLGGEVQNFSNYVNGVGSIDAKDLKIKELGEQ
ncbi:MAG: DUF2807 domain-containing protein [Prevotella sp.]|nr:DUF2807 domain-containing protein [Prevotella sp.]